MFCLTPYRFRGAIPEESTFVPTTLLSPLDSASIIMSVKEVGVLIALQIIVVERHSINSQKCHSIPLIDKTLTVCNPIYLQPLVSPHIPYIHHQSTVFGFGS